MPVCVFVPCRTVSSAPPERARDFAPTVRSGRKGPFRSHPRAAPCGPFGHFASLVASLRKLRFLRRIARQSADWLRARPLRAPALSAPVRRRGSLRPLRFARALDCCAICAAALRKLRFLRRISGGEVPRGWRWRVRAFRGRPRLPPRRPSGLGRSPHPPDAGHPASAEYRLRLPSGGVPPPCRENTLRLHLRYRPSVRIRYGYTQPC